MKVTLIVTAAILIIVYVYWVSKGKAETVNNFSKEIPYGPFIVKVTATTGKTINMNYRMVEYTHIAYNIFYKDKPIVFPGDLQNNTGLPFLWAVYALPDAPDPTLVAGSQSLYLIYLKNDTPVVEPILKQGYDFASLQFLDSQNGQPGPYSEVYMKQETTYMEKIDSLEGGRYLMVSEHAVLDVKTRKIWEMNKTNTAVENYSFPSPHGAKVFSSDQKSIVFHAEFQSWNTQDEDLPDSEHALVVYDFEKDSGYAVKYDDTDTRMTNVQDIDYQWFNTYFEWEKLPTGDRLRLRTLEKLPHWTGKYNPQDNYYTIYPVKPGIVPVFLEFVLEQMGWSKDNIIQDQTGVYTGRTLNLASGEVKLDIGFQEDEQKLTFSKHLYDERTPENEALVKKIADAFNAELAAGKYQEYFGRIISETKRIRGY
ncbi:MAG: hypothetical protein SF052_23865 [Bacteroidia bacterium]|nr:hypothetical protein [Bacteroidia bacterium]